MAFTINNNKKDAFSKGLLLVFYLFFTFTFPAFAQYEQSLEELTETLQTSQSNEELDEHLEKAYSGDKDAQFKLGAIYSNGDSGVLQDHVQAVYWYKKAVEQGHDSAQYNLGHKYLEGKGVEKDINKAIELWKKSAKQQHELAQFNLGRAYYLGIGAPKDVEKSRYWFTQAANNNEVRSIAILKKMSWDTPATETALSDSTALSDTALSDEMALDKTSLASELNDSANENGDNIAIYTNPAIKPLLITIAKSKEDINVITEQGEWLKVNSQIGLPVWTHQDFIKVNGATGTIIGSNVNTRSVPMITRGSIIGRLNKNEKVKVIEQKNEWVRIMSPSRFKGWIKKQDAGFLLNTQTETAAKTPEPIESKPIAPKSITSKAIEPKLTETKTIETASDNSIVNSYYDKIKTAHPETETKKAETKEVETKSESKALVNEKDENSKWQIK